MASSAYDYVVVGAGSAGCVVASRLSEDPTVSVLLLEAGGWDDDPAIAAPAAWFSLVGTGVDWGYRTVPQEHAAGRRIYWPRGKVLGGSSSMNALVYVRGLASDYDAWAAAGNDGWGAESVLAAFRALEHCPEGDPDVRGTGGPLRVLVPSNHNPLAEAVANAALELGHPWNPDLNGRRNLGVGWNQLTVSRGARHSAANAFLRPALDRPNLTIVTEAHAHRILLDGARATAAECAVAGRLERFGVNEELIVCAGAVESPKLLMLSGIGPADELAGVGIAVRHDLPGVGRNLHDHPGIGVAFATRRPVPLGPHQHSELGIFCRSGGDLAQPDLQFGLIQLPIVSEGFTPPQAGFTFYPSGLKPASRGSVRLRSASALDPPLIDPAYLSEPSDRETLLRAIEISREFARASALADWIDAEAVPGAHVRARSELLGYVERAVDTWFHPVGTCSMGIHEEAVVDPQLRVRGIENLRVADASVVPEITSGNTNAPTLMIGWRAADLISGARRREKPGELLARELPLAVDDLGRVAE